MQEASVQGFIRTVLIIFLIYYGLKLIGKIVFPMFFKRFVGKFEERVRNQQGQQNSTQKPNQKVGETVIDKKPGSSKESNNSVGEYVDYEEVE
jgi:hypothetical protein